jgi:hypothetical protein
MTPAVKTAETKHRTHPGKVLSMTLPTHMMWNNTGVGGWDPSVPPLLAPASWLAERERERVLSRLPRGLSPPLLLAVSQRLTDLVTSNATTSFLRLALSYQCHSTTQA